MSGYRGARGRVLGTHPVLADGGGAVAGAGLAASHATGAGAASVCGAMAVCGEGFGFKLAHAPRVRLSVRLNAAIGALDVQVLVII